MISYAEIEAEVLAILHEPAPEDIADAFVPLSEAMFSSSFTESAFHVPIGPWPRFSNALGGGLREREFTILCGPTGAGKTTLLANIAAHLISGLHPILIASVEIGIHDFCRKIISVVTGERVDSSFNIAPQEMMSRIGKQFFNKNTVFTKYDSRINHIRLLCDLLYAHRNFGTKVAMIDNLNFLMDVSSAGEQNADMDKTIHDFVVFCKKVPIHVIMVMHPRKTTKDSERVETIADIKGSSTACQESSNILLYNRIDNLADVPHGYDFNSCREIKFAKIRRNGHMTGKKIIFGCKGTTEYYVEARFQ